MENNTFNYIIFIKQYNHFNNRLCSRLINEKRGTANFLRTSASFKHEISSLKKKLIKKSKKWSSLKAVLGCWWIEIIIAETLLTGTGNPIFYYFIRAFCVSVVGTKTTKKPTKFRGSFLVWQIFQWLEYNSLFQLTIII